LWETYESKRFYHTRYFDTHTKISVFVGSVNKHVHCEVSGQSLDFIRAIGLYEEFMKKVGTRASRIDFAVDFETKDSVNSFIDNKYKGRFKAGGEVFSEDGHTRYIGSWEGERFARVYRYHEPHPRAKLLRAEVVLRGDYAKQAAAIWIAEGEVAATIAAHKPFKWQSDLWQPEIATESKIVSKRSDKESAGTLRWANGDVAAAIARLHNEDLQDAETWFNTYVKPRLKQ
jgi:DNA relaxase NicK